MLRCCLLGGSSCSVAGLVIFAGASSWCSVLACGGCWLLGVPRDVSLVSRFAGGIGLPALRAGFSLGLASRLVVLSEEEGMRRE